MGFGRVLAVAGIVAAGVAWFRRRRNEPVVDSATRDTEVADASPESSDDPVDQAIDESFPASDPPSYAGNPRTDAGDG